MDFAAHGRDGRLGRAFFYNQCMNNRLCQYEPVWAVL